MEAAAPASPGNLTEEAVIREHHRAPVDDPPEIAPQPPNRSHCPIATSGELNLMPPATGLPVCNSALSPHLDSIPHVTDPELVAAPVQSAFDPSEGRTPDAPDHSPKSPNP